MKLSQTGPETNAFGELISKPIAESLEERFLLDKGYEMARSFGAEDAMWVRGPNSFMHLQMEVRSDVFLGIGS